MTFMYLATTMDSLSSDDDDIIVALLLKKRKRVKRSKWVHEINSSRVEKGEFISLFPELCIEDKFKSYFRVYPAQFYDILALVRQDITKENTLLRTSITAEERLALCLRFLATGDSYKTLAFSYRMGKSTVSSIINEVCDSIWQRLQPIYMASPTEHQWRIITDTFENRWQYPNCIGAIDGKHVYIRAPKNSGSLFFNYKGSFSVVLLALVDGNYCFTAVDIGAYGSSSDGGVFANSNLGKSIESGMLAIPGDKHLPGFEHQEALPNVVVGDEVFPLKRNIIRPYPGKQLDDTKRIYNDRHSRARRISENAFGILATVFQIYQRKIQLQASNVDKVIKATCVLHNYIRKTSVSATHLLPGSDEITSLPENGALHGLKATGLWMPYK